MTQLIWPDFEVNGRWIRVPRTGEVTVAWTARTHLPAQDDGDPSPLEVYGTLRDGGLPYSPRVTDADRATEMMQAKLREAIGWE